MLFIGRGSKLTSFAGQARLLAADPVWRGLDHGPCLFLESWEMKVERQEFILLCDRAFICIICTACLHPCLEMMQTQQSRAYSQNDRKAISPGPVQITIILLIIYLYLFDTSLPGRTTYVPRPHHFILTWCVGFTTLQTVIQFTLCQCNGLSIRNALS